MVTCPKCGMLMRKTSIRCLCNEPNYFCDHCKLYYNRIHGMRCYPMDAEED